MYEFQFMGSESVVTVLHGSSACIEIDGVKYKHHINGGGLVAETAIVEATVFVDLSSIVYGQAKVEGSVKIRFGSEVGENAHIYGDVEITESMVRGRVKIHGNIWVADTDLEGNLEFSSQLEFDAYFEA